MIFSRTHRDGNAPAPRWCRAALAMVALAAPTACVLGPSVPANVIIPDAHQSGYTLAFDGHSDMLASGGSGGHVRLWRLPGGRPLARWRAHAGSVQGLAFIDGDREIVSAAYDGVLAVWRLDGRQVMRAVVPSPITAMAVAETEDLIITGQRDGSVRLWRLGDLRLRTVRQLHRGAVLALAYDPARGIASSGADGAVMLWRPPQPPRVLPDPPTAAYALAFSPGGRWLTGSGWFRLFQWRLDGGGLTVLPTAHDGLIKSIAYSPHGRLLASISRQTDSAVLLLNPRTGVLVDRLQPHALCGSYVAFSPDGRYLATTSDDASVRIWYMHHLLPKRWHVPPAPAQ